MPDNHESEIVPTYKSDDYVWIRRRLPLDMMDITSEIMEMPTLIQRAGEISATAIEIREATKEDLERTIAEAAENLRLIPTPKGKDRSESMIASQVHLSDKVKDKKEELSKARLDAALWGVLVESLRKKDGAIRVTADLLNSGFITSSSIMQKRRDEIRKVQGFST